MWGALDHREAECLLDHAAKNNGKVELRFRGFGTTEEQALATLDRSVHWGSQLPPNGRTLLFSQIDQGESDLILLENFRRLKTVRAVVLPSRQS